MVLKPMMNPPHMLTLRNFCFCFSHRFLLSLGGTSYNQTNLCHLRYTKKKCEVSHEHKTTKLFILLLYAIERKGGREWRLWHIVMNMNIAKIFEGISKIIAK